MDTRGAGGDKQGKLSGLGSSVWDVSLTLYSVLFWNGQWGACLGATKVCQRVPALLVVWGIQTSTHLCVLLGYTQLSQIITCITGKITCSLHLIGVVNKSRSFTDFNTDLSHSNKFLFSSVSYGRQARKAAKYILQCW